MSMSDTGIEYSTPSRPKTIGRASAKPTPNTISRIMERAVDAAAFPIACRNINVALFTHAGISMHKYILKALTANAVY